MNTKNEIMCKKKGCSGFCNTRRSSLFVKNLSFFLITMVGFTPVKVLAGIKEDLCRAAQVEAIQPPKELIDKIERQAAVGEPGANIVDDNEKIKLPYHPEKVIIIDYLPYYPYYALKNSEKNVIHPMALGRFLLRNAKSEKAEEILNAALGIAFELPNNGLAWYYPRHYKVARMLGGRLKYSSISQGTIISGLTGLATANAKISIEYAQRAFEAMRWPFEKGGVNLAGQAVLEMPSFTGPPEIILNGWIDAILHILDYHRISKNPEALDFFLKNVQFLAKVLPNFDAKDYYISRYSDLCPYSVNVKLAASEDISTMRVFYSPRLPELPYIVVPLTHPKDLNNFSIYENHISRQNGSEATVWLSFSQLYRTILVANSTSMMVEMKSGKVSRKLTTPGPGGEPLVFKGNIEENLCYAELSNSDKIICGYPTNFLKGGKENYYHVYHVVGLMLLALSPEVEPEIGRTLIQWSFKWLNDIQFIEKTEGLIFRSTQNLLNDINANKSIVTFKQFDQLVKNASKAINGN